MREAWRRGLARARRRGQVRATARASTNSAAASRMRCLRAVQQGDVHRARLARSCRAKLFFTKRLLHDIVSAYYAHPTAWNEIGFGGPASPRGYVRMDFDRRDPWEAAEAKPGREDEARRENARVG